MYGFPKILNSSVSTAYFRSYPKCDGGIFVYEASGTATPSEKEDLVEEVKEQVEWLEELFTNKSASSYPNIEGTTLFRFLSIFLQNNDWEVALRSTGLFSRIPTKEEVGLYNLDPEMVVFLPFEGERLPGDVKKHLQEASVFIAQKIGLSEDAS